MEIDSGANQNTIVGGILSGESGITIQQTPSPNGTNVVATSLEQRTYPMSWCKNLLGSPPGTFFHGVRCEQAAFGPVWYDGLYSQ